MDSVTSSNPMTTKIIQEAIRIGVPLFNQGDVAGCARVYSQAALAAISKGASQMVSTCVCKLTAAPHTLFF